MFQRRYFLGIQPGVRSQSQVFWLEPESFFAFLRPEPELIGGYIDGSDPFAVGKRVGTVVIDPTYFRLIRYLCFRLYIRPFCSRK